MKSRKKRLREVYMWLGITCNGLSLGECALYRHTLRDRLYHRRSSRNHVRFGGLFQLLVRRGSVYPFRNSVRIFFFQFRIPAFIDSSGIVGAR